MYTLVKKANRLGSRSYAPGAALLGLLLVMGVVGCTDESDGLGEVQVLDLDKRELDTVCTGLVEDFRAEVVDCGGSTQANAFVTVGECENFFGGLQERSESCVATVAEFRECYGAIYALSDIDTCRRQLPPECASTAACYDG